MYRNYTFKSCSNKGFMLHIDFSFTSKFLIGLLDFSLMGKTLDEIDKKAKVTQPG